MAKTPKEEIQKMISTYITKLKSVKVSLKGSNLKRIGVPEGPVMGEILRILLTKRLDGELTSKQDEEEFVKSCIEDAKKLKA